MAPGDVVSVMKADVVLLRKRDQARPVTMTEPITLLQASPLQKVEARIGKRQCSNISPETRKFGSGRICIRLRQNKQKARDPFLEPNDIVAISEDKAKSIFNAIGKSLTQGVGTIFYRVTP